MPEASAFERLGAFYLGRLVGDDGRVTDAPLLYDSRDLTTHAVCVGMTGSGKTGLCIALLEEAAIDGVPAIAIDPKGDLGNLLLGFPELAPGDFRTVGHPYGPGGNMYHPGCVDQPGQPCAVSDPHRPTDSFEPSCSSPLSRFDLGILYAPNIIDTWSKPDGLGGYDLYWNVSVWNPYAVPLYRTKLLPAPN